ncbi:unnamed protein product [Closterium sp. NIES-54]
MILSKPQVYSPSPTSLQLSPLLLRHMKHHHAAVGSQHVDCWCTPIPLGVGDPLLVPHSRQHPVLHKGDLPQCSHPKRIRQPCTPKESARTFLQGPVEVLSHAVLLRVVGNQQQQENENERTRERENKRETERERERERDNERERMREREGTRARERERENERTRMRE